MTLTQAERNFLRVSFIALLFVGASIVLFTAVQSVESAGVVPSCSWKGDPPQTYGLGAFALLVANILNLIWGILGSLALVMFVWGGFLWLTARGEEQQIKQGWDTLINAVIGLAIVLGSWVIINAVILSLNFTRFHESPGSWDIGALFDGSAWNSVRGKTCVEITESGSGMVPELPPPPDWADKGVCCWSESKLPDGPLPSGSTGSSYVFETKSKEGLDRTTCSSKGNQLGYFFQEKWFCKDKDKSACGSPNSGKGWVGVDSACNDLWGRPKVFNTVGPLPPPPVTEPEPGTVAPGLPPGSPYVKSPGELPPDPTTLTDNTAGFCCWNEYVTTLLFVRSNVGKNGRSLTYGQCKTQKAEIVVPDRKTKIDKKRFCPGMGTGACQSDSMGELYSSWDTRCLPL